MSSEKLGNVDSKAEFRKPLNDTANRKYRRRSPVSGSSFSSDGSPHPERNSSPIRSRKDVESVAGDKRRKGDDRDHYNHFDCQSSKSSHSYYRDDDYNRRDKNVDDRDFSKLSSHSSRDSRDHSRHEHRHRDYPRDMDRYSQYKADGSGHRIRTKEEDSTDRAGSGRRCVNIEDIKSGNGDRDRDRRRKTDHRKSSGDHKSNRSTAYEETRGLNDSSIRRDNSGNRLKEAAKSTKELDGEKYSKEKKKILDDRDRYKERHFREPEERTEDRKTLSRKDQESLAKKPKLDGLVSTGPAKDETSADEKQSSTTKQTHNTSGVVTAKQDYVTESDIVAAKSAAMKAAELVNKNLIGTGYMSTDQKKKLLWGNKKNTTTEESGRHWDSAIFGDRERQEKFNKLMGVKGDVKLEHKPDNPEVEKQQELLQLDLEKQYTAGLRRRDGRTVGLGL